MVPYLRMWFINATGYFLLLLPSPSQAQKPDFRPTKNWAAVDPLSTAGHPGPNIVSVATGSFRLGMLSAGFGALCRFQSLRPCVGDYSTQEVLLPVYKKL